MFYSFFVDETVHLSEVYTVTRNTVWHCCDKRNILIQIKKGSVCFRLEGEELFLNEGDWLFIPGNTPYRREPVEGKLCTMDYFHFTGNGQAHPTEDLQSFLLRKNAKENRREIVLFSQMRSPEPLLKRQLGQEMLRHQKNPTPYSGMILDAMLSELLFSLSDAIAREAGITVTAARHKVPLALQTATDYIRQNLDRPIAICELSRVAFISQQHLCRLFRKYYHESPLYYINRARIEQAIELFRSTSMTIKQIAYKLGFESENYFCRLFKKMEGVTPLEYKRKIANFRE